MNKNKKIGIISLILIFSLVISYLLGSTELLQGNLFKLRSKMNFSNKKQQIIVPELNPQLKINETDEGLVVENG